MEEVIFQKLESYATIWTVGGAVILMCSMFILWSFEQRYPFALHARRSNAVKVCFHNIKMWVMAFAALWAAGMAAFLGAHFQSSFLFVAVTVLPFVAVICLSNLKAK